MSLKEDFKGSNLFGLKGVVLNGQELEWTEFKAGVPQGSVVGLFLFVFLIHN